MASVEARMSPKLRKVCTCPVEFALGLLSAKWTTLVLLALAAGPARYGELRARLPSLSDKVLTDRLKDLERNGLVTRTKGAEGSRFPVYQLSRRSHALRPIIEALALWGSEAAIDLGVSISTPSAPCLEELSRAIESSRARKSRGHSHD
jgi:DNA-binding HxlR family transcriptional regulator